MIRFTAELRLYFEQACLDIWLPMFAFAYSGVSIAVSERCALVTVPCSNRSKLGSGCHLLGKKKRLLRHEFALVTTGLLIGLCIGLPHGRAIRAINEGPTTFQSSDASIPQ